MPNEPFHADAGSPPEPMTPEYISRLFDAHLERSRQHPLGVLPAESAADWWASATGVRSPADVPPEQRHRQEHWNRTVFIMVLEEALRQIRDHFAAKLALRHRPPRLTPLQERICRAVQELRTARGDLSDESVALKVGQNPRGQLYSRETINRERNKLRKLNIDV